MNAYRDQYATVFNNGEKVVLLAISADPPETLHSWASDSGYPFRFLSDPGGKVGREYGAFDAAENLDNRNLFVVGPDGRIAYRAIPFRQVDPQAYKGLDAAIDSLVARP
jgi:peroxiredoxin